MSKILLRRGYNSTLPTLTLAAGEPGFVLDTGKLYVGNGSGKTLVNPDITPASLGLGTAATYNAGNQPGMLPVVDSTGKLSASIIPNVVPINTLFAYYVGVGLTVAANQIVAMNASTPIGSGTVTLTGYGYITFATAGVYLMQYHATANNTDCMVALGAVDGTMWAGTLSRSTSNTPAGYVSCSASLVKTMNAGDKLAIRNYGTNTLTIPNNQAAISVVKLGG